MHVFGLPEKIWRKSRSWKRSGQESSPRPSSSEASAVAIDTAERLKEGGTERQTEGEKVTLWSFSALSHSVSTYEL